MFYKDLVLDLFLSGWGGVAHDQNRMHSTLIQVSLAVSRLAGSGVQILSEHTFPSIYKARKQVMATAVLSDDN